MRKRIVSMVMVLALCLTLLPATAWAAETGDTGAFTVQGGTLGTDYSYADGVLTINSDKDITISMAADAAPTTDRIEVASGVSANITLSGVNIDVSAKENTAAFKIADDSTGDVTITLDGDNALKSGRKCAGLQKNGDAGSLTITGEGSLTAIGGEDGAGIGGIYNGNVCNITVTGGTIIATGGDDGAGIGGGDRGTATNITISGGKITATGTGGAGIGGGYNGTGKVTISGGEVTAISNGGGAGIGSGKAGSNNVTSNITISGGKITATGSSDHKGSSAGIGDGVSNGSGTVSSTVSINDAWVVADKISDNDDTSGWSGVVFQGNAGQVYGNQTVAADTEAEIPNGATLTIPAGASLTVENGATLTNSGTIQNENTLTVNGTLTGEGTIGGEGTCTTDTVTEDMITVNPLPAYNGTNQSGEVQKNVKLQVQGKEFTAAGWSVSKVETTDYFNYTITYTKEGFEPVSKTVQLEQAKTEITAELTDKKDPYEYTDSITIKVTVKPTMKAPDPSKDPSPQESPYDPYPGQVGVYLKGEGDNYDTVVSTPATPDVDGVCTLTVPASRVGAGVSTLIVKFMGNDEMADAQTEIAVTVAECPHNNVTDEGQCSTCGTYMEAMVEIDGGQSTYYTKFSDAWADVQGKTATVTLLGEKQSIDSGYYIDITVDGTLTMDNATTDLTLKAADEKATLRCASGALFIISGGKITFVSGTYSAGNDSSIIVNGGTVNIAGGTYSANGSGLMMNGAAANVVLTGGTFGGNGQTGIAIRGESDKTLQSLLKDGCAYQKTSNNSYLTSAELAGRDAEVPVQVVLAPVTITTQPVGTTITYGQNAELTVTATATGASQTIGYEWYQKSESATSFTAVTDAKNASLALSKLEVGTYTYYCAVTCDGCVVNSNPVTVTINKATLTPTATAEDKTYDGGTSAQGTITLTGATTGEQPTATGTFAFEDANAGENKKVNVTEIALEDSWAANYQLSGTTVEAAATINPKNIATATVTLGDSLTYTGAEQTQTVTSVTIDELDVTYDVSGNTETNAGTYTLTVTGKGNFTGTKGETFTIARATNSITDLNCAGIVFGETPNPTATAQFGTPTFTYSNAENGTFGEWSTVNQKGTWYVKASVAETDNYAGAEKVIPFTVAAQKELTPSAAIDYSAETLTGLTAGADYAITPDGGTATTVTAETDGTIKISDDWFGKTFSIIKIAQSEDYINSDAQSMEIPARPAKPTQALKLTKTADSITITNTDPACEYSKDGTTWNSTGEFTGMTAGTEYTIQVRIKATDNSFHSEAMSQTVTTVSVDGSTTLKPGESVTTGDTTITNNGDTITTQTGDTNTTIIPPSSGDVDVSSEGTVTIPDGSTVQPGNGSAVTLPDGGTVDKNGTVTATPGGEVEVGDATIIPPAGGAVTVDQNGKAEVPADSTVTENGTTAKLPDGGTVNTDGSITVPGGGQVTTTTKDGKEVTITVPKDGGTIQIDDQGNLIVPGGSTVQTGDEPAVTVGSQGGKVDGNGKVTSFSSGGGSDGGSSAPTYSPTVEQPSEGGTVTVTPRTPSAGDKVTIQPKPDNGYEVDEITVTDRNGKPVTVTKTSDGTYTFIQPTGKVTIQVSYQPIESAWQNPYSDVSESAWYYDAVRFVSEHKLMSGYGDGRFGPDDALSRAQLAQILYHAENKPVTAGGSSFADVADGQWCSSAIAWAAGTGIVTGYGDGNFGPNDPVTREQLVTMLYRYAGTPAVPNLPLDFTDVDVASGYALDALRWAVEEGILSGYDGQLDPRGEATRAQVAAMLQRYLEK